ncbi:MAG: hypothetical protein ACYC24_00840 [Desulfobacteria bacterium]
MRKSKWGDVLIDFSRRFGMLAVNRGYVTPKQLKEAIAEQLDDNLAGKPHQVLGKIFFDKNLMTLNQIDQILDELIMGKVKKKSAVSKKRKT